MSLNRGGVLDLGRVPEILREGAAALLAGGLPGLSRWW